MENLSLKLNYYKKKFKLTNEKVASLAKIPVATVERISSGRTQNPNLKTLKALAAIFECSLDDLIHLSDTSKPVYLDSEIEKISMIISRDNQMKYLFKIISALSDDNRQTVAALAERLKALQDKSSIL